MLDTDVYYRARIAAFTMNRKIDSDDSVENIRRLFASECAISTAESPIAERRRIVSLPDTGYSVNYDDLCGPWSYRENPFHARRDGSYPTPRLCVWKLLTPECISRVRRCLDDETAIKRLIGECLDAEASSLVNEQSRDIFLELAWSIVGFARDNRLNEEATSALVGIFHLTYAFFLSNPWRTVGETHDLFYKTILLHAVEQNPPKSREIFTPDEITRTMKYFSTILLKHLPLVRLVCLPNYRCVATLPKLK